MYFSKLFPYSNKLQLFVCSLTQISMLDDKKTELEKRIHTMSAERDSLSLNLEEAQDRILMLEKTNHEQENQVK